MSIWQTKSVEQSIADMSQEGHKLRRSLTAWDLAILGVAVAIGAGIFSVGAKAAANLAGPAVTVSFIIAGITCALAIMCYAEFASTIPVAGSAYTYTYATMGEIVAWIIGWDLILELLTAGAVIAKYWGIYLSNVFEIFGVGIPSTISFLGVDMTWGPFLIVAVFTFLLVKGTKLSAKVNNVFTLLKVAIVLFVIIVGFFYVKSSNYSPFIPESAPVTGDEASAWDQPLFSFLTGSEQASYGVAGILAASALVFFAFIGFDVVATSAEEVENPKKNLPRGIFGGLALVTALYILVSLAVTGMVSYKEMAAQEAPSLATAFRLVGADWAASVISIGILVGLTTVIMVLLMGFARVVFAMSRDGLLPYSWSRTTDTSQTPARLQIACGVVVAFLAGFTEVDILEEMINIGTLSAFVLVSVGVVVLRRTRPDLNRAYRVPFSPVLPIVSAVLCFYLMTQLTTLTWMRFLVWLLIGFVIYFAYGRRHSRLGLSRKLEAQRSGPTRETTPKA